MKVSAINFKNYGYSRLNADNPVEKPISADISKDTFNRNDVLHKDVTLKGTMGGTFGALLGELLTIGITNNFTVPAGVFWPVAIFFVSAAGLGILGSHIEDKIDQKREIENQKRQQSDNDKPSE